MSHAGPGIDGLGVIAPLACCHSHYPPAPAGNAGRPALVQESGCQWFKSKVGERVSELAQRDGRAESADSASPGQNAWREATSLASVRATHLTVERVEQSILYQV